MRILLLALDVDLSENRGDSVHVRELASHLTREGHEVRLVTGSVTVPTPENQYQRENSTIRQVVQAVRLARNWADVVYERRMSPKVSYAASRLTGIPFVVEVNGVLEDELTALGRLRREVQGIVKSMIRRRFFLGASRVIAVSKGIQESLILAYSLPPERIAVVHNGANLSMFYPRDQVECRLELQIPQDEFLVCFVGHLVPWQGIETLLKATKLLDGKIPKLKVLIVGDGPELDKLKAESIQQTARELVQFLGERPYREIPKIVCASNVCVAPLDARRKASPIKVFEYLACEKPVISSDIDEIGPLLENSGSGKVVEANNAFALADAIKWVYEHPGEAADLGRHGRKLVERAGSWESTARSLSMILQDVHLSGSGRRPRNSVRA
jgi:glycosyltransferase involved in cell wall biosynthesis